MNTFRLLIVIYVFVVASLAVAIDDFNKPPASRDRRVQTKPRAKPAVKRKRRPAAIKKPKPAPVRQLPAESLVSDPTNLSYPEDFNGRDPASLNNPSGSQ